MHIAFCTDSNYIMPTGVAMISVCENNKNEDIEFHIVFTSSTSSNESLNITIEPLKAIAEKYGSSFHCYLLAEKELESFKCSGAGYISTTAFARMYLPELLDVSIKKVIYMDCDTIVDGSLREMWDTELAPDSPFGAVVDVHANSAIRHYPLNLDIKYTYINSGVLLFNLDCWRRKNLLIQVRQCALEHSDSFSMLDQDVLNYLFHDTLTLLSVKFNFQTLFYFESSLYWMVPYVYFDEINDCKSKDQAIIIHYVTPNKPWKDEWCPLREKWMKYLEMSQWKGIDVKTVVTRFDRSTVYNSFIEAYWSDTKLMKEMVNQCVRLQNISVRMKHKKLFVRLAMTPMKLLTNILEFVYKYKTR